jgi:hypothetical protein
VPNEQKEPRAVERPCGAPFVFGIKNKGVEDDQEREGGETEKTKAFISHIAR